MRRPRRRVPLRLSGLSVQSAALEEESLDGSHMVISCEIIDNETKILSHALVDCGATGRAFVDQDFVCQHGLPLVRLKVPRIVEVIDGRPISSGAITHVAKVKMMVGNHREELSMFVTSLGHYPIVLGIPWLRHHSPTTEWSRNALIFDSDFCLAHCNEKPTEIKGISIPIPERPNISMIAASTMLSALKKPAQLDSVYVTTISALDMVLKEKDNGEELEDDKIKKMVPSDYHDFLPLFKESIARALPPHRPYDHRIPLKEGFTPPFGPLYSLSKHELQALRDFLDENLSKGFIRASSSSAGAPVLFIKKKDGSLRLCVDYRGLNAGTAKNRYPLPLVKDTLLQLSKARYYTALDVRGAYNLIRMAEGEEWKTAFRTRYGLFESLVMPFGLTNAPADFQRYINDALHPYLDVFCTAYLDDVLIFSETMEEHRSHVRQVLAALSKFGLHLKPEKCEFHRSEVHYLGLIVSREGVKMDPTKVKAVLEWEPPANLTDVRAFIGFANFYRRFIKDFSKIIAPMVRLTRKDTPFVWDDKCQEAFRFLKEAFTSAPILRHFDPERLTVLETDASNYVSAGVLSQYAEDGLLHPVAFFSKKHSPAECNYDIHDKELLAVIRCCEEWRAELMSVSERFQIFTDHKNLEYFMSDKLLSPRQVRWSKSLSRFPFVLTYRPGKAGGKPDALTRRSGDLPKEGDERLLHRVQTVFKPENILTLNATESPEPESSTAATAAPTVPATPTAPMSELFAQGYAHDPIPGKVLSQLRNREQRSKYLSLAECEDRNGTLYFRDRIYVPDFTPLKLRLIQENHDIPTAGHPGRSKTLELLMRQYHWPGMHKEVGQYVRNCHICQRSRTARHAPFGILRPLPIPEGPWQDLSMDFITGLPWSNGYNAILVVVCRLTKMRHFVPCRDTTSAEQLAELFLRHVHRLHGLPRSIVSDRGPQFVSRLWSTLCSRLGIAVKLSTPYHPQTDGQTERANGVLEQYLRAYVNYLQDDWEEMLHLAEFAMNNQASETTGISPFFANYGYDPRASPADESVAPPPPPVESAPEWALFNMLWMKDEILDHLRAEIQHAQSVQQESADARRSPAPAFRVGDQVWFNAQNVITRRPSRKLDARRLGPYTITRVVSPYAYELEFPASVNLHRVQHVSLLDPVSNDPLPGQHIPPPPPILIDEEPEWYVEEILDSRFSRRRRRLEYLVKWVGYGETDWQSATSLNRTEAVERFHARYPDKPGPLPEDSD